MKCHLISIGKGMPMWVTLAFQEYSKRLPSNCALVLHEIKPAQRSKNSAIDDAIQSEGEAILNAIPESCTLIALDIKGQAWSTETLSEQLGRYRDLNCDVAFCVGGADGLSDAVLKRATHRWSLSNLTFPHPLVRVILAEQIYRAYTLWIGHPYHRGA